VGRGCERDDLRGALRAAQRHKRRVTVVWHCGEGCAVFCSTGEIARVGCDFVSVRGRSPTLAEGERCCEEELEELETIIPLRGLCAVFDGLRDCRRAGLPACCVPAPHQP